MKVVRLFLFSTLAVVVVLAALVAVAFTSGFQTWAARRALAHRPDLSASLGRVEVGLNHVRIEQFRLVDAGASLTLPSVDVDLSVVAAARRNVQVRKLVAKGWTVDLTSAAAGGGVAESASAAAPAVVAASSAQAVAAFEGIFNRLKLPVDLAIDSIELEGEIILPLGPGRSPGRVRVSLAGTQLGAGREGKFVFSAATVLAPTQPVNALNVSGTLDAAMDTPRTFSRLAAAFTAEARGPQFPQGTRLSAALTAGHANAGESYTVALESAGRKLLAIQADYPANASRAPGEKPLKGTWMLDMNDGDLAPFTLGRPLPGFAAKGQGRFDSDVSFSAISASGRLALTADKLGAIRPELDSLGAIRAALDFDLTHEGDTLRVTSLALELAGSRPVLQARSLQPFEFNVKTRLPKAADPAEDLVSLDLQGLPLAWTRTFAPDVAVTGDDVHGTFVLGLRNSGTAALRPITPLILGNVSIVQAGKPVIRAVDLTLKLAADYTPQGWQADFTEVVARSTGATLFTLEARAGRLAGADQPVKMTGQWTAGLPALLSQPAASGFLALTGGRAAGDFAASFGAKKEIQAKVAVAGLTVDPKVSPEALPALDAELRAEIARDGKVTLNLPLVLDRGGRKSDLTVDGTISRTGSDLTMAIRATSSFLAVEDAQVLAALLPVSPVPAQPAPEQPPRRDSQAFWSGVYGRVAFALKKVSYQQKFDVTDVVGTVQLDPAVLKWTVDKAGVGEGSDLKLSGNVAFDAKGREPYLLRADLALDNFDAGPLFRALDPSKPPTIEGKFDARSQVTAPALNPAQLLDRVRGDFQLTSKSGICRLLQADLSDKIQKTQSTVATLGGLLGAVTGQDKIANYANRSQIVVDVANDWKEIPFDQLNVVVRRDNDLNIALQDFTLISPTKRIAGTGEIRHADGTPVLAQALDLRLQLGARGKTFDLMNRAGLLNGQKDDLGYTGFLTPVRITGTLENPNTGEFRAALLKAAGGSLLNNLLGR